MYTETQWPRVLSLRLVLLAPPVVYAVALLIRFHDVFGFAFLGIGLALFAVRAGAVQTIRVVGDSVQLSVYGIRVRTLRIDEIERVQIRKLAFFRLGGSYGSTSVYNWAGLKTVVEFSVRGKGKVRVGSHDPQQFADAIAAVGGRTVT